MSRELPIAAEAVSRHRTPRTARKRGFVRTWVQVLIASGGLATVGYKVGPMISEPAPADPEAATVEADEVNSTESTNESIRNRRGRTTLVTTPMRYLAAAPTDTTRSSEPESETANSEKVSDPADAESSSLEQNLAGQEKQREAAERLAAATPPKPELVLPDLDTSTEDKSESQSSETQVSAATESKTKPEVADTKPAATETKLEPVEVAKVEPEEAEPEPVRAAVVETPERRPYQSGPEPERNDPPPPPENYPGQDVIAMAGGDQDRIGMTPPEQELATETVDQDIEAARRELDQSLADAGQTNDPARRSTPQPEPVKPEPKQPEPKPQPETIQVAEKPELVTSETIDSKSSNTIDAPATASTTVATTQTPPAAAIDVPEQVATARKPPTRPDAEPLIRRDPPSRVVSQGSKAVDDDIYRNRYGMVFMRIPAGEFKMGSPRSEDDRESDEAQHTVRISKDFWMASTEVTQKQWERVMRTSIRQQRSAGDDDDDYNGIGGDHPMKFVTWYDAQEYCRRLSEMDGRTYRLPTEAEWEYAARAGTATAFAFGNRLSPAQANVADDSLDRERTVEVESFRPNKWGLYDMHGNVREWVADWYDDDYNQSDIVDPKGPAEGDEKVLRGGSWKREADEARSAARTEEDPGEMSHTIGFRVVLERP